VRGVDMSKPMDPATFKELHDAWMQYLVIVFPEQHVTDEQHVAFTRNFGEPEIFHQSIIKSKRVREIFRVSNVDDEGKLMPPDHPTVRQLSAAQYWHTDSSYRTIPCTGALLHGVEVSRTGGETEFTNMYLVYEALPEKRCGAAGVAADGAHPPRHGAQVALHQPDLQRRSGRHVARGGEEIHRRARRVRGSAPVRLSASLGDR